MKEKGLLTVNKFLEKLDARLAFQPTLQRVMKIKTSKQIIAKCLLDQNYLDPRVFEHLKKLHEYDEVSLLSNFMPSSQMRKTLNLLKKINKTQDVESYIQLYEFILDSEILDKLTKIASKQLHAIEHQDEDEFLNLYEEQLLLEYSCMNRFYELPIQNMVVDTVHARNPVEYIDEEEEQKEKYSSRAKDYAVATIVGILILACGLSDAESLQRANTWAGIATIGNLSGFLLHQKLVTKKNLAKQIKFVHDRVRLSKKVIDLMMKIQKKYGVKITGRPDYKTLTYIEEALSLSSPVEVKNFLVAVHFESSIKKQNARVGGKVVWRDINATYYKSTRSFVLRTARRDTIFHEFAHARSYALPSQFFVLWEHINDRFAPRKKVRQYADVDHKGESQNWLQKGSSTQPGYGYARPYGLTDPDEDVATMVDLIAHFETNKSLLIGIRNIIKDYETVYIQKVHLLLKFAMVTQKACDNFIKWIKSL